jgi:hypothetical protein
MNNGFIVGERILAYFFADRGRFPPRRRRVPETWVGSDGRYPSICGRDNE